MFKKIIVSFIAAVMLFTNITYVSANQQGTTQVINDVQNTGLSIDQETISLFQVLKRDGYGYKVHNQYVAYFEAIYTKDHGSGDLIDFVIEYLNTTDVFEVVQGLTKYTNEETLTSTYSSVIQGEEIKINSVDLGYYLILKGDDVLEAVATVFITEADLDAIVYLKASKPTLDKEVYDYNDKEYGNANTAGIGDVVQYKITTTIPETKSYSEYTYTVHDAMSDGLTFNDDVVIYINDAFDSMNILSSTYYRVSTVGEHQFSVDIDILKAIQDNVLTKDDVLSIYYSATLNEDALIVDEVNLNTAKLEYSNNPFDDTTSDTVDVTTKTYSLKLAILKVSSNGNVPLEGVEFSLNINNELAYFTTKLIDGVVVYTLSSKDVEDVVSTLVTDVDGKIMVVGLNDYDNYTLVEIKPLDGYLNIADIEFEFDVDFDDLGNLIYVGSNLGIDQINGNTSLDITVINYSEIDLPNTGGSGSSMFIIVGTLFIVIALGYTTFILYKNKTNKENEKVSI